MFFTGEQWLALIAIITLPFVAGQIITGVVIALENRKMRRRHAEFERFLASVPDVDDDFDERVATSEDRFVAQTQGGPRVNP